MEDLDRIQMFPMPLAEYLGVEFLEAGAGKVTAWLPTRPEHATFGGSVHGGAIMAFADSLGAAAAALTLPEDAAGTTTLESKTNFVGSAPAGAPLVGVASVEHAGRRTQVVHTRIETSDGRLVALVSQTQMTLFDAQDRKLRRGDTICGETVCA